MASDDDPIIDSLWEMAHENIPGMHADKCSLFLPLRFGDKAFECLIDTGAEPCVLTENLVKELGMSAYIDRRMTGKVIGVGSNTIVGVIPYVEVILGDGYQIPLSFTVVASAGNATSSAVSTKLVFNSQSTLNSKPTVAPKQTKTLDAIPILGMTFLMFYRATIDLGTLTLNIGSNKIPLILRTK